MLRFVCDNGSFEVHTTKEYRDYSTGKRVKYLEVTVTSQNENIDGIENIITDPFPESFKIVNEVDGNIVGAYDGYKLANISRKVEGNNIAILISFFKEG